MTNLYAVRKGGLCPGCGYGRDEPAHYRIHVPRNRWPESMGTRVERVVVDGKVYDKGSEPGAVLNTITLPDFLCQYEYPDAIQCGYVSASADEFAAHQSEHEAAPGEASAPASPDLAEVADAGSAPSPGAALGYNQEVYLEPEPWPSPAETWGEPVDGLKAAIDAWPTDIASLPVLAQLDTLSALTGREDVREQIAAVADRIMKPGPPSEGAVRINPYPEIVIGPYERPAPVGLTCDVCGKVCKHLGALTGHKRSHKG